MVGLGLRALSINLMVVVAFCLLCPARSQEIHVVPNSPLVEALENGNFVLQEFHSDGGRIAAGRSRGKLDAAPYAAISHRRIVAADGEGGRVRVEWRVGNCEVGDSSGVYSVLFIQGSEIGTCWFPHCFAEIPETQHAQEINVFLRHADGGHDVETEVPSRMVISGVANDSDVRDTHRQQTCLPLPVTSPSGDLHITDVVVSQVHQQLVLFGPTSRPLGGLYCVWDKNPQTCQEGCSARKVCHPNRIPLALQQSSVWARPPDSSSVLNVLKLPVNEDPKIPRRLYQCVFDTDPPFISNASLVIDNQLSHNLAFCDIPASLRTKLESGSKGALVPSSVSFQAVDASTLNRQEGEGEGEGKEGGGGREREPIVAVTVPLCPYMTSRVEPAKHELSICAIFRDQAPYLAEWVEYHLLAGVDHIYLYDHKSVDGPAALLHSYIEDGVLDLHFWDRPGHPQKEAFLHCTHKYGHESKWMAMIDVDEFLLAGDGQTKDIKEVLDHFDYEKAMIYVQEMFFGHQNYELPPAGLVIENYLNHSDDISKFQYRKKYIFRPREGHIFIPCIHDIASGFFEPILLPPDVLRINHYTVKSRRHWEGDHIKRYQPCTDEWNEVRETLVVEAYLSELKVRLCERQSLLYDGENVRPLPPNASCREEVAQLHELRWPPERFEGGAASSDGARTAGQITGNEGEVPGNEDGIPGNEVCSACAEGRGELEALEGEGLGAWLACVGWNEDGIRAVVEGGGVGAEIVRMAKEEVQELFHVSEREMEMVVTCASFRDEEARTSEPSEDFQENLGTETEKREKMEADAEKRGKLEGGGEKDCRNAFRRGWKRGLERGLAGSWGVEGEDGSLVLDEEGGEMWAEEQDTASGHVLDEEEEGGEPELVVDSPVPGTTALRLPLLFRIRNLPEWAMCCVVEVSMDTTSPGLLLPVAVIDSPTHPTVLLDRNRTMIPFGPTWHTVRVRLLHADAMGGPALSEKQIRFRLTGARKLVGGEHRTEGQDQPAKDLPAASVTQRKGFPVAYPKVCAAFMSSNRLHLLRRSLSAFIHHMETFEPSIPYEIAWVDNDSGPEALLISKEFEMERTALFKVNYGATHGINSLFDMCRRAEFMMTMEEDWEWKEHMTSYPAVDMALQVLAHDPILAGILFREELDYKAELSEWMETPGGVRYRRHCMKKGGMGWGAWTNGAAIWKRKAIQAVGRQNEQWGDGAELEYAQRFGSAGWCTGQIQMTPGCEETKCNAVTKHIGESASGKLIRSPGWEDHVAGFV